MLHCSVSSRMTCCRSYRSKSLNVSSVSLINFKFGETCRICSASTISQIFLYVASSSSSETPSTLSGRLVCSNRLFKIRYSFTPHSNTFPVPVSYIYCLFLVVKTVPRLYPRATSIVSLIFFRCSFIFLLLSKTFSIICLSTSYLFLLFFVIHSLNCFFMIFLFLLYVFCVDNISYIYSKKEHPPVITTNGCFSSLYILFSLLYLDQYFLIHTHSDVTLQSFLQYRDLNHFLQPFYF